jgi:hypothetical protein
MMYQISTVKLNDYTHFRVAAMLLRDKKGNNITEDDWQKIDSLLLQAWQTFSKAVK